MSLKISSIENLIAELKCTQCKKLLSVLPVYYCAAIGNVCGRCAPQLNWMISNGTLERATAYEAVAKYLIFPCINKENGCKIELKWNQIEEHEKSCVSTPFICPFNAKVGGQVLQCPWKDGIENLVPHLFSNHKHNVKANSSSFILNVHESNVQIFIQTVSEQTFVVLTKFLKETNKFYCVVMCCNQEPENQFYRYQLELGRYDDYFLILRKNNTEKLVNVIDNYEKMITVDVLSVAAMLGNSNLIIYCKVGIVKKNKKEINAIKGDLEGNNAVANKNPVIKKIPAAKNSSPSSNNKSPAAKNNSPALVKNIPKPKLAKVQPIGSSSNIPNIVKQLSVMDKQLLEELECPVCSNYMIPPIFICSTGHSICSNCKDKIKECPSCRLEIKSIRNYTLEKLTTRVKYPCKYSNIGCIEIFTSEFIRQHENSCPFNSNKCPLKMLPSSMCNLKTAPKDVISHIREKHAEYVVEVGQEYSRNIKSTITSSYYVTIYENEIFIICCKHSSSTGPIKFNFLHVGMKKNQPKFRYELEFIDQTNKGMKFIINQLCQVAVPNLSAALKNCLMIPMEMLSPFIFKNAQPTLFFKFRIEKI